ncbi:MAG: FG-GAP-like repeat-containing protein [Verrucomicrobiota bacterium]
MKKTILVFGVLFLSLGLVRAQAPAITALNPATGVTGVTIDITGTNFSPVAGNNIVFFGAVSAAVTAASGTNLTVTVPAGATYAPITVTVNGLTAWSAIPFLPTFLGAGPITNSSLAARLDLPTGSGPSQAVIADMDGDGKPDVIIADCYAGQVSIYRNISTNGSLTAGSFASRVDLLISVAAQTSPYTLQVADLDGDGRLDIVALNADSNIVSIFRNISSPGSLTTNSFAPRMDLPAGNTLRALAVRDLNGDGLPEIVTANQNSPGSISVFQNQSTTGNISFAARVDLVAGNGPAGLAIGDLDGDGNPDLAVVNAGNATISVLRNLGTGGNITTNSFAAKVDFACPANPFPIAIGDMDGDSKLDLVVGSASGQMISVFRNTATVGSLTTGSFAARVDFAAAGWVNTIALGDLDGDGKLDIALGSQISSVFSIFKNISTLGSFTTASLASRLDYGAGVNPYGISIGDLDNDGRPDVVFVNQGNSTLSIYKNLVTYGGPPQIISQPANQSVQIGGTANFTTSAGGSSPLSYQWIFNGTNLAGATNATLTLTNVQSSQAGNYAVSVTNVYGSQASSNAALAVILTVDHFVWSPIASPQSANQPLNVSIVAKNLFGVTVTNFNGSADLSASASSGAINSTIVISEIDPNTPDYIEFMNVSANPVNLSGWQITIYDSTSYPNPVINFVVPTNTIVSPNQVFSLTEFGAPPGTYPNFFTGGNINWVASGGTPIAVLVRNASGSMVDFACVGAAAAAAISNPVTISTNQWSGGSIPDNSNGSYNYQRIGNRDHNNSNDWVTAPPSLRLANAGLTSPFIGDSSSIPIFPTNSGTFDLGVWNGNITVQQAGTNVVLTANDGSSHAGSSNPFNVIAPPTITSQPTNLTVNAGSTAIFTAVADGTSPLSYQWTFSGVNLPGATNATLSLPNAQLTNGGDYLLVVTNLYGAVASSIATLTVLTYPPAITTQPTNQTVNAGNPAIFTAVAGGTSPLRYQWTFNGTNLPGATNATLTLPNAQPANGGDYLLVVTNLYGAIASSIATLTVLTYPPSITTQPTNQTVNAGSQAAFTAVVGGTSPLSYQWNFNGTNLPGATSATLTLPNAQPANGGDYLLVVTNLYGAIASSIATLSVLTYPPTITSQPTNLTVYVGSSAAFSAAASGTAPLSYQWQFNGTNLAGATNAILTLANVQLSQAGNYALQVTNIAGTAFSSNTVLTVNPVPPLPVIIGFSPASAVVGANVTISGTNFSPVAGNNIVFFGAVSAAVTAASGTNLTVTVPAGATYAPITVTVNGLTAWSAIPFLPTFLGAGPITNSSLAARLDLPTGSGPSQAVIADMDGDGKPDVIIADCYAGQVSIYRNISTNGSLTAGSFASRVDLLISVAAQTSPYTLQVADLDGDGRLDIVALNADSNIVSIFRNISSPGSLTTNSFAPRMDLPAGNTLRALAVRDLNGDGLPEIVTANQNSPGSISVFQNQSTTGNISFAARVDLVAGNGPAGLAIGDLDGDGNPDLAVVNAGNATISVLRNLGTGGNITTNSFAAKVDFACPANPFPIAIGDMDGDSKLDLVVGSASGQMISVFRNTATVGSLTTGSFAARVDFAAAGWVNTIALGDLDGDGKLDIALGSQISSVFSIFKNISTPDSFTTASLANRVDYGAGSNPYGVSIGDLDGDGRPDIIFVNTYSSTLSIYKNLVPLNTPPVITTQPQSRTNVMGTTATFVVAASGTAPFSYQWSFNGTNLASATNATLTLTNVQSSQAGVYSALVGNRVGSSNSMTATLTIALPPTITQQPQSQTVMNNSSTSFTVAAAGTSPLNYQWRRNGTNLVDGGNVSGSTTANLNLAAVGISDTGNYDVVVTNPYATTNSAVALLTLTQTGIALGSASAMSGGTVVVPVLMNALGAENTFLATVGYDPALLVLQSVQLGQATAGAYLQEVDTRTNAGLVGFAVLLNMGETVSTGTNQEIAWLTFQTLAVTTNTTVNLFFTNNPTLQQTYDNSFNLLPTVYTGGTVTLLPSEYAADVFPRTNNIGDHQVTVQDWLEIGRMVAGLDTPASSDELLRADCAPRNAPDGALTVADWVQAGRYALNLDPLTLVTPAPAPKLKLASRESQSPSCTLQLGKVPARRGQTVGVPVELVGAANENAVGLTVSYDTNKLRLTGVTRGPALSGGRTNINNSLPGKLGIAVALSPGATLAAGTNQLLVLQFTTIANASGTAALALDSSMVKLQVADKTANVLAANYANGTVELPQQPILTSQTIGANLQLTWDISTGTFQVQTANNPLGPWTNVVLPFITNGVNVSVSVMVTNQQQYYKLVGQ